VFKTSFSNRDLYLQHQLEINMDARLQHPFTAIVAGPTGCGKSVFTFKLISEAQNMIFPPPEKIMYCYSIYQSLFDEFPSVEFNEGLPELSQFDGKHRYLLILDDMMTQTNDTVSDLFTKVSHHKSVSVIFLSQNIFHQSKQNRTMSLNSHYLVLFKNPRDAMQVATFGRQMYPGKSKFLVEAFTDATSRAFGYLLIDLKPETEQKFRVRTNIFQDERQYVYIPK
jgi:Adenovirus IVa2 protein